MIGNSNTQKTQRKMRFKGVREDQLESSYVKKLESLLEEKRLGDWGTVSSIVGITSANTSSAFYRVHSKYHNEVVKALEKVIKKRNSLLK